MRVIFICALLLVGCSEPEVKPPKITPPITREDSSALFWYNMGFADTLPADYGKPISERAK